MTRALPPAGRIGDRVAADDWGAPADRLDEHGSALTGRLLGAAECREIGRAVFGTA